MSLIRLAASIVAVLASLTAPSAQEQGSVPAFDAASVKTNTGGAGEGTIGPRPGGYVATNVSLRLLIIRAYGLRSFQVVGGPGWIDGDRFDVVARAPEKTPPEQVPAMLKTLLADRFKLTARLETREQPIFALVPAPPVASDRA